MKTLKTFFSPDKVASFILYFSILTFIIAFNFSDNPQSGWYQQFMPNLNNKPLIDITFTDSLTGYAIASNGNADTSYVIKTTNGGDNWNIILKEYRIFKSVVFLNNDVGYVGGGDLEFGSPYLIKTINGGLNWFRLNAPNSSEIFDMSILNQDTLWITDPSGFDGGIFRTTNGGTNWTRQTQPGGSTEKIYMYNRNIGFASSSFLFKTTNSGLNWNIIPGQNGYNDIYFSDSLTGWKSKDSMRMTTDGGITWTRQYLPEGGFLSNFYSLYNFSNINRDTIWGSGGVIDYPGNSKGFLYRTTNGGNNWQYQVPDTNFGMRYYQYINFINYRVGWSYTPIINRGIHTIYGGDTLFYTYINNSGLEISKYYFLYQNYPNPFNPKTKISFELQITGYVKLKVFDIQGKEIESLINEKKHPGKYEIEFDGSSHTSGVYFYKLEISVGKERFTDTKRMILLK